MAWMRIILALAAVSLFVVNGDLGLVTNALRGLKEGAPAAKDHKYTAEQNSPPPAEIKPVQHETGRVRVSSVLKDLLKTKRKRNIGITISIRPNETSVWTNGAKQNAFFMYQVYTHNDRNNVYLINLHQGTTENLGVSHVRIPCSPAQFDWNVNGLPIMGLEEALTKDLDVVVESGMQISPEQMHRMQKMGIKVASFRCGNDYFMIAEELVFQRPVSTMFMTLRYDALWTLPSYDFIMHWQSTMFRAPIEIVPYVWSPFFHDKIAQLSPERPKYSSRGPVKTISIFEPNLYIVKNFVMPLAMVEEFYRAHPELVKEVYVLNADKFVVDHPAFDAFTSVLDVVQQNKTRFMSRFRTPWFLAANGDVVLSHQMHNDLNFLYLDALYARYPLVHNSPYFKDCGYYYDTNNITMAAEKLYEAFTQHDSNMEAYNRKADECLERFSVFNQANIDGYEQLVDHILALPPRFPPGS